MENQAIQFYNRHQQAVANWGLLSVFGEDRDQRRLYNQGKRLVSGQSPNQ